MTFTAKELKQKLWNTIVALEEKKIDPRVAQSIICSAREIVSVIRVELEVLKMKQSVDTQHLLGQ